MKSSLLNPSSQGQPFVSGKRRCGNRSRRLRGFEQQSILLDHNTARREKNTWPAHAETSRQAGTGGQASSFEDGVIIAGAGIAGLATAAALQKVGIAAKVLERDPGPRLEGSAIGLWPNAFKALDALGVAGPLREAHPVLQRIQLSRIDGTLLRQFSLDECDGAPHEFRGVLRSSLLRTLEDSLQSDSVQYSSPISEVQNSQQGVSVRLKNGEVIKGKILVGADGARSAVAKALNMGTPSYAGYSAYRGVADFNEPLPVAMDTVRQILGQGVRAGMYPLSETSLYWFIAMSCPAEASPSEDHYKQDCLNLVKGWKAGILEAVDNTSKDGITRNRIADRWLVPSKPFGKGSITLAGDSAHPMTPNLGQGGCTALEDAVILAQSLRDASRKEGAKFANLSSRSIQDALRAYEQKRSLRVTKISVRSNLMGRILGSGFTPVCAARDLVIEKLLPIKSFMNHTQYDCGTL